MKSIFCILSIVFAITILGLTQTVQAQTNVNTTASNQTVQGENVNFTNLFRDKYKTTTTDPRVPQEVFLDDVKVRYESPTTVLISGDLISGYDFNSRLWEAMDILKSEYGFKVQQVMTSGEGSNQNPTEVYILMTK